MHKSVTIGLLTGCFAGAGFLMMGCPPAEEPPPGERIVEPAPPPAEPPPPAPPREPDEPLEPMDPMEPTDPYDPTDPQDPPPLDPGR